MMEHIVEFLRSMDELEMADEVANAHNRLECYSTGITNDIIESLRSVAEKSLAELAALKAENESLKLDAERLDFVLRKQLIVIQDCDDKYFTYNAQSGKRGPEMDSEAEAIDAAMAQGEK